MDKRVLKNIILDQHNIIKEMQINQRDYELEDNMCYVLVGMRRVGKSTLLYSKVMEYINKGIDWSQIIYINFEDERLSEFKSTDFQDIILVKNEFTTKKGYYFFDEIQNIDGWDRFARRMADANEIVYITGSNSKMLSNEVSAKLGGRYISKYIMPYNFKEYINANHIVIDESTKSLSLVSSKLNDYINYGGLPACINLKNKREYLTSVYDKLLLNDVMLHNNIRNERYMKILVKKIAEMVKDETSYTRLSNIFKSIGFSSSKDTIINYIGYLEEANLLFAVKNYYASFVQKESTPKYYFMDNGILNLFLNDKLGLLFENMIAVELKRSGKDFYYLKSLKNDVDIDFYLPDDNIAIQASISIKESASYIRETEGLVRFAKIDTNNTRLFIITLDDDQTLEINGYKIEVVSLRRALLMK